MIIDSLTLRNFRLFEETQVDFHDRTSVIVGVNGSGKSSVLDAMSILLTCYIGGFDGFGVQKIARSDIRRTSHGRGSTYENVPQLPVELTAEGSIGRAHVSWKSTKLKDSPHSSSPSAYDEVTSLAEDHQRRLREDGDPLSLPLIAHYGTERLWRRDTSDKRYESRLRTQFRRLSAYDGCLGAHVTDTSLVAFYERMEIKRLQQGSDVPEFAAVRRALKNGIETLTGSSPESLLINLDTHELEIAYEDHGAPLRVSSSQLGDGYRVILNLLADIAWRAVTLNPHLGNSILTETEGIVLIDEMELHLHPTLQWLVLGVLTDAFPKMQFVVTTNSPVVVSSAKHAQLVVVDEGKAYTCDQSFYGRDVESVLSELMGVPECPREVKELLDEFYAHVDEERYDAADQVLDDLRDLLGEESDIPRSSKSLLDFLRLGLQ